MIDKYSAQYAQDRFINDVIFKNKPNGFFLDIGAHDGVTFSNSYFFENALQWNGICVEPIPEVYEQLEQNRNCIKVNAAITSQDGFVKFTRITGYAEMLSGITESYDLRHLERIQKDISEKGGKVQEIDVVAVSLNTLFNRHQVKHIDLVTMDTEGNEYPIIANFPFHLVKPLVFAIENNYKDNKIAKLLKSHGYKKLIKTGDDIFYCGETNLLFWLQVLLFRIKKRLNMIPINEKNK
jgi:FkbM family methyltransferase